MKKKPVEFLFILIYFLESAGLYHMPVQAPDCYALRPMAVKSSSTGEEDDLRLVPKDDSDKNKLTAEDAELARLLARIEAPPSPEEVVPGEQPGTEQPKPKEAAGEKLPEQTPVTKLDTMIHKRLVQRGAVKEEVSKPEGQPSAKAEIKTKAEEGPPKEKIAQETVTWLESMSGKQLSDEEKAELLKDTASVLRGDGPTQEQKIAQDTLSFVEFLSDGQLSEEERTPALNEITSQLRSTAPVSSTGFFGGTDDLTVYAEAEDQRRRAEEAKSGAIKDIIRDIREFTPRIKRETGDRLKHNDAEGLYKIASGLLKYMQVKGIGNPAAVTSWLKAIEEKKNSPSFLKGRIDTIFEFFEKFIEVTEAKLYKLETIPLDSVAADSAPSADIKLIADQPMSDTEKMYLLAREAELMMMAYRQPRFVVRRSALERHIPDAYFPRLRRGASVLIEHQAAAFGTVAVKKLDIFDIIRVNDRQKGKLQTYIITGVSERGGFTVIPLEPPTGKLDVVYALNKSPVDAVRRLEVAYHRVPKQGEPQLSVIFKPGELQIEGIQAIDACA